MRRLMALVAVVGLLGIAATSASWGADAQGDDGDLRTQVADLQTRVAALETRVAGDATTPVAGAHTITGDFRLNQKVANFLGTCAGYQGFDDIQQGAQVTVRDGGGQIIAVGELGPGVPYDETGAPMTADDPLEAAACVFPILVSNVPDSDFYAIEVSHRGELTYTRSDLEAIGWEVHFTLG